MPDAKAALIEVDHQGLFVDLHSSDKEVVELFRDYLFGRREGKGSQISVTDIVALLLKAGFDSHPAVIPGRLVKINLLALRLEWTHTLLIYHRSSHDKPGM